MKNKKRKNKIRNIYDPKHPKHETPGLWPGAFYSSMCSIPMDRIDDM